MAKAPKSVVNAAVKRSLSRSEECARSLTHSAFDLSDSLFDFATWLSDESFVSNMMARPGDDAVNVKQPMVVFKQPIAFADYNGDNKCQGVGLRAIGSIDKAEEVFKI